MSDLWYFTWIAITSMLIEEPIPIMAGIHEHSHPVRLLLLCLWISVGTWAADILLYYLGRWRGHWVRKRLPRVRALILRTLKLVRRHPWRSSLAVRYAYALRLTLPIVCGVARIPVFIYVSGAAISAVTWSVLTVGVGWAFGHAAQAVLGHVKRYEVYIFPVVLVIILGVFLAMRKRHVENEVVEVLAKGDPEPHPRLSDAVADDTA